MKRFALLGVAGIIAAGGCGSDRTPPAGDGLAAPMRASNASAKPRISSGTGVTTWLETTLDSGVARVGDVVSATVIVDVLADDGRVALPAGSSLIGSVTHVQSALDSGDSAFVTFLFHRATLRDGSDASLRAEEGVNRHGWTGRGGGLTTRADLIRQLIGTGTEPVAPGSQAPGLLMSHRGGDIVLESGSVMELLLDGDVALPEPAPSRASLP